MRNYGAPKGVPFKTNFRPTGSALLDGLVHAVECGDPSAVKEALDKGADPNAPIISPSGMFFASPLGKNLTPMRAACVYAFAPKIWREIILVFAAAGGDPGDGVHTQSAFAAAGHHGQVDLVELFAKWGADPDGACLHGVKTPLIQALDAGSLLAASKMIELGAGVDYIPPDHRYQGKLIARGKSALAHCCSEGSRLDSKKIKLLLDAGADPNLPVKFVGSPFWLALSRCGNDIAPVLDMLEAGADARIKGKDGSNMKIKLAELREREAKGVADPRALRLLDQAIAKGAAPRAKPAKKAATAPAPAPMAADEEARKSRVRKLLGF